MPQLLQMEISMSSVVIWSHDYNVHSYNERIYFFRHINIVLSGELCGGCVHAVMTAAYVGARV